MSLSDPVADVLIRIKNGYLVSKQQVTVRFSKLIWNLCQLLKDEGYIVNCERADKEIRVTLKYNKKEPVLAGIKRVSKPGLRVYKGVKHLPRVLNGLGIAIISTPKGIMTDKQARKLRLGGEVMAEIW